MVMIQVVGDSHKRLEGEKRGPQGQNWSGHKRKWGKGQSKCTMDVKHGGPYPCINAHIGPGDRRTALGVLDACSDTATLH
jgi:hypothetical protein